jgi:hypothetical protein
MVVEEVKVFMAGVGRGKVIYRELTKEISVEFPSEPLRKAIYSYLHTKREFQIPESPGIDDFRIDEVFPYENQTYFELSMCTLWANTGVLVDWSTEKITEE